MRPTHLMACIASAVLASHGLAQLPTGGIAVAAFAGSSGPGAILHLDPATNSCVPLYGTPQDINSLLFDSASGAYYVGGTGAGPSPAPGEIVRLDLQGSTVVQSGTHAWLPAPFTRVPAMTMDENGNLIVAAGTSSSSSDVLRIDRQSGAILPVTSAPFSLRANALTGKDVFYVALLGATTSQPSEIWRIDPNGTTQQIATTYGVVTGNQFVSGLALGPDRRELWVSCFGYPYLFKVLLDGSTPAQVVPVPLVNRALNDVRYHEGTQRFFFCSAQGTGNEVWSVDANGNPWSLQPVLAPLQNVGTTSQLALGAQAGDMTLFPCGIPALSQQVIHIEATLHGLPGESCIVYVSGLQLTYVDPPIQLPLAAPLLVGALQPDMLSLPPLPLGIGPSDAGVTFLVGHARLDPMGNLIEHEIQSAALALQQKQNTVARLDFDPATAAPPIIPFGAVAFPGSLKVQNTGPNTVYLMERDPGPPPGPWTLVTAIHAGETRYGSPPWPTTKEYRVELVGGPRAKATINYN